MKRLVVIHQPDFLPWIGYFHRLLRADLIINLDHAQFVSGTSRSWIHRDLIKTRTGTKWLSLSLQKAPLGTAIRDMLLSPDPAWRDANVNLLRESYRTAPYFQDIFPLIERLYHAGHVGLAEMNLAGLELLQELLDIHVKHMLSSEMAPVGKSNAMLVDLLQKVEATHYLSGLGARAYLDPELFAAAGIEVIWQDFTCPVYPQLYGDFIPKLSTIDMLFNCGIDRSREILRAAR